MPRRSGTTTVWSFASSAAIGDHMSPVSPKPWISTTAGPWPPTRAVVVAAAVPPRPPRQRAGVHHLRAAEVGREGGGRGVRRQGAQRQAGGEAGRYSAEAAGERGRNGCGHA